MLKLMGLWYIFCLVFALYKCMGVAEWLELLNLPLVFFKVPAALFSCQCSCHFNNTLTSRIFSPSSSGVLSWTKWLHSAFGDEQSLAVIPIKSRALSPCPSHRFKITRAEQQGCSKLGFPVLIGSSACATSAALSFNRFVQKLFLSLLGLCAFSRLTDLSFMVYKGRH